MTIQKSRLIKRFCKVINGFAKTENIPLRKGNMTVSIRDLDTFEKQSLGYDPVKKIRCLYIEGKISIGNGKKKEYYVQYINYEDGHVDMKVMPGGIGQSARLYVGDEGLDQSHFEEYVRRNILPLFK